MDGLLFHKKNFDFLKNAFLKGKLHHAYIFYGPSGAGKLSFAIRFSRFLHCLNNKSRDICGKCVNCRSNFLNDIYIVDGKDKTIHIEEVREGKRFLDLSSADGRGKVLIINSAENLTDQASELLLKTLEEPPGKSFIVLTTSEKKALPDTVLSRCHSMFFPRPSRSELKVAYPDLAKNEFFDISYLSNCGSIDFLEELRETSEKDLRSKYDELISELEIITGGRKFSKMVFAKEIWEGKDLLKKIKRWIALLYFIFLSKQESITREEHGYNLLNILEKGLDYGKIESTLAQLLQVMEILTKSNVNERILLENFMLET